MAIVSKSVTVGGNEITIETGKVAKQTNASVWITCNDTVVLITVGSSKSPKDMGFLPLTVDFIEKFYSVGKIPGGFFKRETRPSADATLVARIIDRQIRPLFAEGYKFETQVIATVLSADHTIDPAILAAIGASAGLMLSDIPWAGPVATCEVGRINGELVLNPTLEQREESDIEYIVASSKEAIVMVEGGSDIISEKEALEALKFAFDSVQPILKLQEELQQEVGKEKKAFEIPPIDEDLKQTAAAEIREGVKSALAIPEKLARYARYDEVKAAVKEKYITEDLDDDRKVLVEKTLKAAISDIKYEEARKMIVEGTRIAGRAVDEVRKIDTEAGLLPRTHGSALFTRGETQVIAAVTLGSSDDEQRIDSLEGDMSRRFMLHYNFLPFSVGETGFLRATSRREVGHGNLAKRALSAVLPEYDDFPYTLRVVTEVLESNGSSSMGTVCSGSMALMDAGVPLKGAVAGIAMGLIKEDDKIVVLSDILGDEDHLGDMDLKVAGTREGISALQMDIKISGITMEIMEKALEQAKAGRIHILDRMAETLGSPREELSPHAPRIFTLHINTDKIRDVIGPGGKIIRGIIEETGVKMDIDDTGRINIFSSDQASADRAIEIVSRITEDPEIDKVYMGKIARIVDFGAFVEILPGKDGLLHISEIEWGRVERVEDVFELGQEVEVKVLDVDPQGKVRLSRKALLEKPEGYEERPPRRDSGGGGRDNRGGGNRGGGNRGGGGGGGYRR